MAHNLTEKEKNIYNVVSNYHYDYEQAIIEDAKQAILDNYTRDELIEKLSTLDDQFDFESELNDQLWIYDSVTGNASGSYTFSTWKAEINLMHNLNLLFDAINEFGCDYSILENPESCDVTIRCYLLPQCIASAIEDIKKELDIDNDNK